MNLLVTGGAGFIGSHFIETIIDDPRLERIVNLDALTYAGSLANTEAFAELPHYHFEHIDLQAKDEVLRVVRDHHITHVVHFAAETHVDNSIADPNAFIHTNVAGTFHLLEACREAWTDSTSNRQPALTNLFIHISTDEVYGALAPDEAPFTEDSAFRPNSPYAASKAAADHLARSYHRTFGLPVVITRCTNNYGPRQHREKLIPTVLHHLARSERIPIYGDGQQVRDWIHVIDHCQALRLILDKASAGTVYNIGSNNEITNLALVRQLCDLHDEMAPSLASASHQRMAHVQDRPGHDRRYAINAARLRSQLGWQPAIPFETGLRELVAANALKS